MLLYLKMASASLVLPIKFMIRNFTPAANNVSLISISISLQASVSAQLQNLISTEITASTVTDKNTSMSIPKTVNTVPMASHTMLPSDSVLDYFKGYFFNFF